MASTKSPEMQKKDKAMLRKLTIELIIVAAGYCLVISGYTTLINLQSSINITGGVGEQLCKDIRGVPLKFFLCPKRDIIIIMVLARSNRGTIGRHAPIISIHDTWCAGARGSRDTNRGWPHCPFD